MNGHPGTIITMAIMLVASSSARTPCRQPLEIRANNSVLAYARYCDQKIDQELLLQEPEFVYYDYLQLEHRYTLFFLESNENSSTYTIHWALKDILPINKSLTANKTVVMGYLPPRNINTTAYSVMIYKQHSGFQLSYPSHLEMKNFIPERWAQPFWNISLEYNGTFHVTGRDASKVYPNFTTTGYHSSVYPQIPAQPHPPIQPQPPYSPLPAPSSTVTPSGTIHQFFTPPVIPGHHRPGYNMYNTINTTNITSTHQHPISTHTNKNGASNIIIGYMVIMVPIISLSLKAIC